MQYYNLKKQISVWIGEGAPPLFGEWGWSPSNTNSPGMRPTSILSGILMHPPFGHNRNGPEIGEGAPPHFGERGLG